jgi:hypothetical protein
VRKPADKMGAPGITGRTKATKVKKQASVQKRKREDVDVEKLEQAVAEIVCIGSPMPCSVTFRIPFTGEEIPKRLRTKTSRTLKPTLSKISPTFRSQARRSRASSRLILLS